MKFRHLVLTALLGLQILHAACGPKQVSSYTTDDSAVGLTAGTTEEGRPYTSFGPAQDIETFKENIHIDNKNLVPGYSSELVKIKKRLGTNEAPGTPLRISGIHKDGTTVEFGGRIAEKNGTWSGELKPLLTLEKNDPSVSLQVVCDSPKCDLMRGTFKKEDTAVGGFIMREEDRILEKTKERTASPPTSPEPVEEQIPAHIASTEIIGGPSQVEITPMAQSSIGTEVLEVPLVDTDGDCVEISPIKTTNSACLMGNSRDGEIVLKVSSPEKNENSYVRLLPREHKTIQKPAPTPVIISPPAPVQKPPTQKQPQKPLPPKVTPSPPTKLPVPTPNPVVKVAPKPLPTDLCFAGIPQQELHPWTLQVIQQCENENVVEKIKYWTTTGEKLPLGKFLALRQASGATSPFQLMIQELARQNLPQIIAFVSYIESGFRATVRSAEGAFGWWQFMPATANSFGLKTWPTDQRADIALSTRAAAKYLGSISEMPEWRGNLMMTLAGYNMGHNGLLKKVKETTRTHKLSLDEIAGFSPDFWTLARLKVVPAQTRAYVPKALSAMYISLIPERYSIAAPAFAGK